MICCARSRSARCWSATDVTPPRRRQLTLFVPNDAAHTLEAVRERLDPVQHRLIPAHVTLCREDELERGSGHAWRDRLAAAGTTLAAAPVTLTFGSATAFSGHGVLLPCIGGEPAFHALRVLLLGDPAPRRHEPHLTLAHPRNPRAPQNVPTTYADVPSPLQVTFRTVCLIEQSGDEPWQVLETYTLCG